MPKNEYKMGEYKKNNSSHGGPGGPGGAGGMTAGEKADDFGKAIGQLLAYCKKYLPFMLGAVILAAAGAILNIIGPNKLADITDLITE